MHRDQSIKFTYQYSTEKATFLDVDISKNIEGTLNTSVPVKKANNHQYIEYSSFHPPSCKKGLARLNDTAVLFLKMKILRKSLINSKVIS